MTIYLLVPALRALRGGLDFVEEQWVKYESYQDLWDDVEKTWPGLYKPTIKIVEILDD